MEASIIINNLVWSFRVDCECPSLLHIKFRHGIQFVSHTSSIFSAAYATYLYPGYRGSGTILPVGTGDKIGLTENSP